MRIVRTTNQALIGSILRNPLAWEKRQEDGVTLADVQWPIVPMIHYLAMVDDTDGQEFVRGLFIASPLSKHVLDTHVVILPEYWRSKRNVVLGQMAVQHLLAHSGSAKLSATIPVPWSPVVRYFQRLGFQREGVSRASFKTGGQFVDQYYLGIKAPHAAQNGV